MMSNRSQRQFSKKDYQLIISYASNKDIDGIIRVVESGNPTERSLIVRYSIARKIMKEFTKDEKLLDQLIPPKPISERIMKESIERRDLQKKINVTQPFIEKVMSMNKNKIYDLCIYLLFITGRRTGEILNAKFTGKRGDNNIHIDGVLKRSDNGNGCTFPSLISKTKTLSLIKKFKNMLNDKKDIQEASFRRELLRQMKHKLGDEVHPHMLRGIYVNYLYKFRNNTDTKINTFIMENLCHETVTTSMNYTGYEIVFNKDIVK